MRKTTGNGTYSNQKKQPDLDCCVCIHRKECDRAQEGSFCTRFSSRDFDPRGEDPNDLWKRGEDADL